MFQQPTSKPILNSWVYWRKIYVVIAACQSAPTFCSRLKIFVKAETFLNSFLDILRLSEKSHHSQGSSSTEPELKVMLCLNIVPDIRATQNPVGYFETYDYGLKLWLCTKQPNTHSI